MTAFTLTPANPDVYGVYGPDGAHVGYLKRIGAVWKFKAIGYDAAGQVIPGGGPCTAHHNSAFHTPDAQAVGKALAFTPS